MIDYPGGFFKQMEKMIYSGRNTDSVCPSDKPVFGSTGSASTSVENIDIIGYFEEIRDLIRKKHVNLAGLQCPPFWAGGVARSK